MAGSDIGSVGWAGRLIDAYFARAHPILRRSVASRDNRDGGVPPEMWAGPVDREGWVEWKVLPSSLTDADISEVESTFAVAFPPSFRAYLVARFHCFNQLGSKRYNQQILWPGTPARTPLRWLRRQLEAWAILVRADLIPFAEWGDGWGPMCFDARHRGAGGECPILWLDHEMVIPLGEKAAIREELAPLKRPLYASFPELTEDVFGSAG